MEGKRWLSLKVPGRQVGLGGMNCPSVTGGGERSLDWGEYGESSGGGRMSGGTDGPGGGQGRRGGSQRCVMSAEGDGG